MCQGQTRRTSDIIVTSFLVVSFLFHVQATHCITAASFSSSSTACLLCLPCHTLSSTESSLPTYHQAPHNKKGACTKGRQSPIRQSLLPGHFLTNWFQPSATPVLGNGTGYLSCPRASGWHDSSPNWAEKFALPLH